MNKWYGKIGFVKAIKQPGRGGVYREEAIEKSYYGDVLKNYVRLDSGQSINTNPTISNSISVVADSFALSNVHIMRYIEFCGALWEIKSIDVQTPRLILTIGGVWNGETAES